MRNRRSNAITEPLAVFRINFTFKPGEANDIKASDIASLFDKTKFISFQIRSFKFRSEVVKDNGYIPAGSVTWYSGKTVWADDALKQTSTRPDKLSPEGLFMFFSDSEDQLIFTSANVISGELTIVVRYNLSVVKA